ncbi:DoxX family protein [Candidatus Woesearchaeota archaeon]|nr:DoxX family protein [Candidatus Woesearchaeota archaeon]
MLAMIKNYREHGYVVFRVLVGLLFLQHGLQKVFGMFGGVGGSSLVDGSLPLFSLMALAGIIELVAGVALALGLFVRPVALIAGVEMLVAYFKAHMPAALFPIQNGGEAALLYFAAFLVIFMFGARKWGLEKLLLKKEMF